MKEKHISNVVICLIALFLSGCAIKQSIRYDLNDIQSIVSNTLKNFIFSIETFGDERKTIDENKVLFEEQNRAAINGKTYCINSEKYYKENSVPLEIAEALQSHLAKRKLFQDVFLNQKDSADFYLTGKIKRFYGQQEFSTGAVVGSQFGLIGALATMNIKTHGVVHIEFSDLHIHDRSGNIIASVEPISQVFQGQLKADAYCWAIYWNVNEKLKVANDTLMKNIETALTNALQ